jgi:hypothetical protein
MQVLLEASDEEFLPSAKQTHNKNQSIEELSPYARQFFWIFPKQKKSFVKPAVRTFFQPYSSMSNKHGLWLKNSWDTVYHNLILGIIESEACQTGPHLAKPPPKSRTLRISLGLYKNNWYLE